MGENIREDWNAEVMQEVIVRLIVNESNNKNKLGNENTPNKGEK